MPLYVFECKKCHHRFERIVKYRAPSLQVADQRKIAS